MRKITNPVRTIVAMAVLTLTTLTANAQNVGDTFTENGIKYEVTNVSPNKVKVIANDPKPTGDINIPASVTNNSIEYAVTTIGSYAFYECRGLTSIDIPNSVTEIENRAFRDCSGLTSITIPNSVTVIREAVFNACTSLTSVTIPTSVTTIERDAFSSCTGLTSIEIPNSVTTIGYGAFSSCIKLTSVTISSSVKTIEERTFSGCRGLTSIIIPNSVTVIREAVFNACTSLTSVTIPNSVTTIGENAFWNCTGLTSIEIPNSVTNIGFIAFGKCTKLTSITSKIENISSVTMGNDVFYEVNKTNCTLKVPKGKVAEYNTGQWVGFNIVEETSTGISTVVRNPISVVGNNITISKVANKEVKLYSLSGQVLYNLHATQENITLSVKQAGTYILQVGNATRKIVVN